MSDRHPRAFPDLAPPAGGLARLRARVDGADRRRARLLTIAFVPSLALAAVIAVVIVRAPAPTSPDAPSAAALAELPSFARTGGPAVTSAGAPAVAVPLDGGVTLYWVP